MVEDKEKAVDMAYAGKARREAAQLMEKVNPAEAHRLRVDADAIEGQAGEKFDSETEKLNMAMSQIGDTLVGANEGKQASVSFDSAEYPIDRIRQQFYKIFGATQQREAARVRSEANPYQSSKPEEYSLESNGYRLFEKNFNGVFTFGLEKIEK